MKSNNGSVRRERPTSVVILAASAAEDVDKIGDGGGRPHWLKICLSVLFIVSAVIIIVSSEWLRDSGTARFNVYNVILIKRERSYLRNL